MTGYIRATRRAGKESGDGNSTESGSANAEQSDIPYGSVEFGIILAVCVGLVFFAALMSGLTMALMSLDKMNLSILAASGTPTEQKQARKLRPLLKRRHLLLVTLLIGNAAAMEALPIFLDKLVPEFVAIILSVTFVLIFGEIIPQALFTKYRLPIGSALSPLVWLLELISLPVSYPIALLLDFCLGKDHPTIYRRAELKELTKQHLMDAEHGHGNLSHDEVRRLVGALESRDRSVESAKAEIRGKSEEVGRWGGVGGACSWFGALEANLRDGDANLA